MDNKKNNIISLLIDLISQNVGIPIREISVDASIRDELYVDSLGLMELILTIESRFQIRIPDAEIGRFAEASVKDAAALISAKIDQSSKMHP